MTGLHVVLLRECAVLRSLGFKERPWGIADGSGEVIYAYSTEGEARTAVRMWSQ